MIISKVISIDTLNKNSMEESKETDSAINGMSSSFCSSSSANIETMLLPNPLVKNTNNVSKVQVDDGIEILPVRKIVKEHVTAAQKDFIFEYVTKYPEIITHNTTPKKETDLWNNLVTELNNLKPKKPLQPWKNFWKRWLTNIKTREESQLSMTEIKLKQYVTTLENSKNNFNNKQVLKDKNDTQNVNCNQIIKCENDGQILNNVQTIKRENYEENMNGIHTVEPDIDWRNFKLKQYSTLHEINQSLSILEEKRYLLNLEIDNNDYRIVKYSNTVKLLQKDNVTKREEIKEMNSIKLQLLKKRKYLNELKNSEYTSESYQHFEPCKKIKQELIELEED